ncbi:MAG: hypothetical protein AAB483_01690 [Patescibacteria group bacterium]
MNTVLNVKVDPHVKILAQKTARDLGVPLSIVVNTYLKEFVHTKELYLSSKTYRMTPYLEKIIEKAEKNIASGNLSPAFDDVEDAIKYLHNKTPKKK